MHWAGLLGSPRRTDDVSYFGTAAAHAWMPEMIAAAVGGTILFISILMFAAVAIGKRQRHGSIRGSRDARAGFHQERTLRAGRDGEHGLAGNRLPAARRAG